MDTLFLLPNAWGKPKTSSDDDTNAERIETEDKNTHLLGVKCRLFFKN